MKSIHWVRSIHNGNVLRVGAMKNTCCKVPFLFWITFTIFSQHSFLKCFLKQFSKKLLHCNEIESYSYSQTHLYEHRKHPTGIIPAPICAKSLSLASASVYPLSQQYLMSGTTERSGAGLGITVIKYINRFKMQEKESLPHNTPSWRTTVVEESI